MDSPLSICTFVSNESLAKSVRDDLSSDHYLVTQASSLSEFFAEIEQHKQEIDCLVLQEEGELLPLFNQLYEQGTLLPIVIFKKVTHELSNYAVITDKPSNVSSVADANQSLGTYLYHAAEVHVTASQANKMTLLIDQAIARFLTLAPSCRLPDLSANLDPVTELNTQSFLMLQQRRLAEKLQERLGYLGVYYKRNSQAFFRHLSRTERQEILNQLKAEYRQIVINYFSKESTLNQAIDQFVTVAFFADMSVSQIVEIHMELMDEFSKYLQLEGRSEEILLDYRLTLIDVIAHLCEMYRRSIPRES
ncbi:MULTISPECIES: circadian clock protein KaiA [Cyanophyceae]|uniref:circadian clock protein KaiA n=1 Tax=Cyanophyceae TaxID=3028117 RepID=UPI001683CA01|nr:circadian clock protein KaiA [Trichocoleus sp. FACHB-69]